MPGARGETTLQADGREVRVLFTNRALADVEKKLGRNIIGLLQGFTVGDVGMTDVVTLLQVGMEAARRDAGVPGPPIALNTAYDVLDVVGFGPVAEAVMESVAEVLSYGEEGEVDAYPEGTGPNP